ncbi:MAG TPA: trehalose-phosphatase [Burkholderiaceae bacterium]|jgi:trehalose 6-phosphate phosphatase|nr:trehalose-phosphatase [Burkholderiaceae bacterium]
MSAQRPPVLDGLTALFLDFDGTLAPIAPRPQDVQTPAWVVPTLRRLQASLGGALALLSGRPLAQIDAFLSPLKLPAAGVHGVERRMADGRVRRRDPALPEAVRGAARQLVTTHRDLLLEDKPGALAVHFRAAPALGELCADTLRAALGRDDEWELLPGHEVIEVKPRGVCKGSALCAFLGEERFTGRRPVVVGDDVGDESAIVEAQLAGGFGVRVGPGQSAARYRLADTRAVRRWLMACAKGLEAPEDRW